MIFSGAVFLHLSKLLAHAGYFTANKEDILEVGLIVGGSVHQPLHCDVNEPKELEEGEYDLLMKQPHAPASILVSMGGSVTVPVRLGVANKYFVGERYVKLQ